MNFICPLQSSLSSIPWYAKLTLISYPTRFLKLLETIVISPSRSLTSVISAYLLAIICLTKCFFKCKRQVFISICFSSLKFNLLDKYFFTRYPLYFKLKVNFGFLLAFFCVKTQKDKELYFWWINFLGHFINLFPLEKVWIFFIEILILLFFG